MCGQFILYEPHAKIIQEKAKDVQVPFGLIRPSDSAFVWSMENGSVQNLIKTFGWNKQSLILHARQETVFEKQMFSDAILHRRCVIPCSMYYEFTPLKERVGFYLPRQLLYMAGLYENNHFVVLTTKANPSVIDVHDRMPVLLQKEDVSIWLNQTDQIKELLLKPMPLLQRKRHQKQLSFF